jgi:hypothetical protein
MIFILGVLAPVMSSAVVVDCTTCRSQGHDTYCNSQCPAFPGILASEAVLQVYDDCQTECTRQAGACSQPPCARTAQNP